MGLVALVLVASLALAHGQPVLQFVQSTALTGQIAASGHAYTNGFKAAFAEFNNNPPTCGPLTGAFINLTTLDDGYTPTLAAANAEYFLNGSAGFTPFAFVGTVGTPTSLAITPLTVPAKVPFMTAFTGTSGLRTPFQRYIVNLRASYVDEAIAIVNYLTNVQSLYAISVFYQNDSYGQSGLLGVNYALAQIGLQIVSSGVYARNTLFVEGGLATIFSTPVRPKAIIMICTDQTGIAFVNGAIANYSGFGIVYATISFANPPVISSSLGSSIGNTFYPYFVFSNVMPNPTSSSLLALVLNWRNATEAIGLTAAEDDFIGLEGYAAGTLITSALRRLDQAVAPITSETMLDNFYSGGVYDLGDVSAGPYEDSCLTGSPFPCCNQGMHEAWMYTVAYDGSFQYAPNTPFQFTTCGAYLPSQSSSPLVFGVTAPLTGPYANHGKEFVAGLQLAFAELNGGGSSAHPLLLLYQDDQNDPLLAKDNLQFYIQQNSIFALLGGSTVAADVSDLVAAGVPMIGNTAGYSSLVFPFVKSIINIRPSLVDEFGSLVFEASKSGAARYGVVYLADDPQRQPDIDGLDRILATYGLGAAVRSGYNSNATSVQTIGKITSQLFSLDAVIIATPNENFTAQLIRAFVTAGNPKLLYLVTSLCGRELLLAALTALTNQPIPSNIIVAQVVPTADQPFPTLQATYANSLNLYPTTPPHKPNTIHFEGYIVGRFLGTATALIAGQISRAALTRIIYDGSLIPINELIYGPYKVNTTLSCPPTSFAAACGSNQGGHSVWVSRLTAPGNFTTLDTVSFPNSPSYLSSIQTSDSGSSGLSAGAIAGIVIGSVIGGLLIIGAIVIFLLLKFKYNLEFTAKGE